MPRSQLVLPLGPVRNSDLFSNHWLEHRLPLEPEWQELRADAERILNRLAALWQEQRGRVEHYEDEQGLEQAFIQPVLTELGWKFKYQVWVRGHEPDYALFLDNASLDRALQAGRKSPDFWKFPRMLADAKAWHRRLDRPAVVNDKREYPPEQIERYLANSNLDYAILMNGKRWRLIPRSHAAHQPRFQTYLECDLPALIESWETLDFPAGTDPFEYRAGVLDDFLRFYLFFSPVAFRVIDGRKPLMDRAIEGSSEYRLGVGEGLKERVFEAMRLSIEGFLRYAPNNLDPVGEMALAREQSFTLLFRLLFCMFAEDRGLLPYRTNALYTENRSLRRHRDELADSLDRAADGRGQDFPRDRTAIWDDLLALFDLIDRGHARYGVPAYNGGLFDAERHPFLAEKRLPDWYLARVIDQLGRTPDPDRPEAGLFLVDYRDLAIQHLGSIYEGLLELHPHYADQTMRVVRPRSGRADEGRVIPLRDPMPAGYEATATRYEPGDVYLLNDKGERRSSGSYYTPNHIVDYIVRGTLAPLCRRIDEQLTAEIADTDEKRKRSRNGNREEYARRLEALRSDFDDRVLALHIVDPAMGSGHFLLRACQYLAEEIATNPNTGDAEADQLRGDEPILTFWKRRVVERCLYGVELNPMAVELAKLALWLETVSVSQPLTFLDHHLRHGNSLVGADLDGLGALPGVEGLFGNRFANQVQGLMPVLMEPLQMIRGMASDTAEDVKKKARLYENVFSPVRDRFVNAAHLWCATFFLPATAQPLDAQYQAVLEALGSKANSAGLAGEPWFRAALDLARQPGLAFFHWELEFPEVFFDSTCRRPEAGFDAVIGNPPYEVLSEKESGQDLAALRAFLRGRPVYGPSFRGKNNLYKLFICRALALLAEGGRLGFITPMALLGDDQAADLRREILARAAFTFVDSFPQKDDPEKRIFAEAKLTTVVFGLMKTENDAARRSPFTIRVHPENVVREDSTTLSMSSADIPLYDPNNFTIASCAQADWDLAIRIIKTGRMKRLKEFAEFFQGEVNETNERAKGNLVGPNEGGKLVIRGAGICLYVTRPASQGDDLHLNVPTFLQGKGEDSKAYHHRHRRVGLQESCPQNNFRRIIAAIIPAGEFCNHKVNYLPEHMCMVPLEFALALLDSRLADWYFRLGSTNAAVSHYQLYNLPCPEFSAEATAADRRLLARAVEAVGAADYEKAFGVLAPALAAPPFGLAVRDTIMELVNRIIAIEAARGEIARAARSALDPAAQPLQNLIDRLLYAMAGLTDDEARALEDRLSRML